VRVDGLAGLSVIGSAGLQTHGLCGAGRRWGYMEISAVREKREAPLTSAAGKSREITERMRGRHGASLRVGENATSGQLSTGPRHRLHDWLRRLPTGAPPRWPHLDVGAGGCNL